jgi:hypothetical protein
MFKLKKVLLIQVPNIDGNANALSAMIDRLKPRSNIVIIQDNKPGVRLKTLWL